MKLEYTQSKQVCKVWYHYFRWGDVLVSYCKQPPHEFDGKEIVWMQG